MSAGFLPTKFRYVPRRQVPSVRRSAYASASEISGDMIGDDLILGHLAHGRAGRYKATAAEIMAGDVDGLFRRHVNTRIRGHHRDRYWTTQQIDDAVADPDTTAPILSSLFLNVISTTEANVAFTTDDPTGTVYWVVVGSVTPPDGDQIKAGTDGDDAEATQTGSIPITTDGEIGLSLTGLVHGNANYIYFMHEDPHGNQSNILASDVFIT